MNWLWNRPAQTALPRCTEAGPVHYSVGDHQLHSHHQRSSWRLYARKGRAYEENRRPIVPLQYQPSKKSHKHNKADRSKLPPLEEPEKPASGQLAAVKQRLRHAAGEEDAAESDSDDSTTNISDLDDEEWDALWESGEETSSESGFDIDDGWAVEDVKLDSPPRMDRIGRFDKQLRNTSKARKLAIPLTGRSQMGQELADIPALASLPPQALAALESAQARADANNKRVENKTRAAKVEFQEVHKKLRIITGSLAGKVLASGKGQQTRPMMGKVRSALFDMLLSLSSPNGAQFPAATRWLDLYAGTGSVGLEALSRGVEEAHFIELDPWVLQNVLKRNVKDCRMEAKSKLYASKVEFFLQQAQQAPQHYPSAFDYISVCPPYLQVSYPELMKLLAESPFMHENTRVIVEYPRSHGSFIQEQLGSLHRVRCRKYGRTFVAVYGPESDMSRGQTAPVPRA